MKPSETETPDEVFEALLQDWLSDEYQIHGEWGAGSTRYIEEGELMWRGRFGNAIARERNRRA